MSLASEIGYDIGRFEGVLSASGVGADEPVGRA